MCLGHVVNLGTIDVMGHITKIAAVETTTAIWEYDPDLPGNRVLGGSLDVIAAIRTLAVKIQCSGQRIEYFNKLQRESGIATPFVIPLHSNVRWGSAYKMLDRAYRVRQAVRLFIAAADELFGPITILRRDGRVFKKIPWSAFKITEMDWVRVLDVKLILEDSNHIQQYFSSEHKPTLWRALPAIEELQTAWEAKRDDPQFAIYRNAIVDGLAKLNKYYSRFDEKPSYILALVLHPYYKLSYIAHAWGGEKEEEEDIRAGKFDAKNWQAEARKILENTVRLQSFAVARVRLIQSRW